ncbi:hypothetical protein C0991_006347, partial [Blastosporella zonata]
DEMDRNFRAPFATLAVTTCAAFALWYYASRSSKVKPSKPSTDPAVPTTGQAHTNGNAPPTTIAADAFPTMATAAPVVPVDAPVNVAAHAILSASAHSSPTSVFTVPVLAAAQPAAQEVQTEGHSHSLQAKMEPLSIIKELRDPGVVKPLLALTVEMTSTQSVTEAYAGCAQILRQTDPPDCDVTATFIPDRTMSWSLSNLTKLGQAFTRLREADEQQLCKTLTVELANWTDDISSDESAGVDVFLLPAGQHGSLTVLDHGFELQPRSHA